jgi:uncharacterized protein YdcH (DUF465 family)
MYGEHHNNLSEEFPEFKDKIHKLKVSNHHFSKLYEKYQAIDNEIYRIEEEIETPSDAYTEDLKKQRLKLKDELCALLKSA